MSIRSSSILLGGGDRRDSGLSDDAVLTGQSDNNNNNLSDDDNEHTGDFDESDAGVVGIAATGEKEDPLLLAIDDLEGRVVSALDDVRVHPGVRTAALGGSGDQSIHDELSTLLRPVLEVAAHTGPSVARTYYRGVGNEGIEASVEDVYDRVVSDLVLPVMLEIAQSDTIPAKRACSLTFFRNFWSECQKAGSWLDNTATGPQAGPYGAGGSHIAAPASMTPALRAVLKRRQGKRLAREGEILRYWVQASIACTVPGVFTSDDSDSATASRGIIAASASLRPSLRHIAQRIKDADDRGASRLFGPVMKMLEGVLKKIFLETPNESVLSACIKFLEIVVLCCSHKPAQDASHRRRSQTTMEDFSLEDLPAGHPVITREALESMAEYTFTVLRGLTIMGGQVKLDVNVLSDLMLTSGADTSPTTQVVSILKPAALAYLEVESSIPKAAGSLDFEVDRSSVEFDFLLAQKSYALTINAMSALAINRPVFFKEAALCLARRAMHPPVFSEGGAVTKAANLAITAQLRASCLTLLRNALSVTTNTYNVLHQALKAFDMEIQADKALSMAEKAVELSSAGRYARNRANMYYEWDASESDQRVNKRQRETDDALAKMRAAKAARGLGHGIHLPTNMTDAVELIMLNLGNLPSTRPASTSTSSKAGSSTSSAKSSSASTSSRKVLASLDAVVDAIMTNGGSLMQEEGRWYDRDGGDAWMIDLSNKEQPYQLSANMVSSFEFEKDLGSKDEKASKRAKLFLSQCQSAASEAVGRILAASSQTRSKSISNMSHQLAARLAFTLNGTKPSSFLQKSFTLAKNSASTAATRIESNETKASLRSFVDSYPLVASSLAFSTSSHDDKQSTLTAERSLSEKILNEAFLQPDSTSDEEFYWKYDRSLDLFVSSVVYAGEQANERPADYERKKTAAHAAATLQRSVSRLPRLTRSSLLLIAALCDTDDITKKAADTARKASNESIVSSAAAHAAKVAAEKRATAALLLLRDAAFQRDVLSIRNGAVECCVAIAAGRLPASPSIQDKALKLTMNVLFTKSESLADCVADASVEEVKRASDVAISLYDTVQKANKEGEDKDGTVKRNPLAPVSEEERQAVDRMRKPAVLCMALCVRRTEMIQLLFSLSCLPKADVLSKAVRQNMSKLTRATAAKYGAATIALQVAGMTGPDEIPMLLSFLENLSPSAGKVLPDQDVIDACFKIQDLKSGAEGNSDPRFIIPIVSALKRQELVKLLPDFVGADDNIFLAALVRMGDRVGRQALFFRDEPDEENPTLLGMTLCEQLVFLHKLDFAAASLPQKRYLSAIKLCLEDDEVYNDRVLMSALDQMSGTFLTGVDKLPLAFMRTCILVCTKHESLHSWICHELLPRLVDGRIYDDARQWEGWMRCAHMLEKSGDPSVSSREAILKLPPEQLMQYQTKWAGK